MARFSLICADPSTLVLLKNDSRYGARALAALVLTLCGAAWPSLALADEAPATPDAVKPGASTSKPKIEVLAHAFHGNKHVGMLGVGLESAYMATPHWGFGGAVDAFYVDNGSDPQYSEAGTLDTGFHGLLFAEGDLLPGFITPYARLGLGVGNYTRYQGDGRVEAAPNFVGQLSGGLALRGGPIVGRLHASPMLFEKDLVMTYGVALGARF